VRCLNNIILFEVLIFKSVLYITVENIIEISTLCHVQMFCIVTADRFHKSWVEVHVLQGLYVAGKNQY
jgi:hypothetical protein